MKRLGVVLVVAAMLGPSLPVFADDRGWEYLIEKLVADGVERERVVAAFRDPRVAPFVGLEFSAATPHEPRALYRGFLRPASVAAARRCRLRYAAAFEMAQRTHGVSADVLAAILFIESGCGGNTGSYVAFYRLARLAMANEPQNLRQNIERRANDDGTVDADTEMRLRARARSLEHTFYPEVRALFAVADRLGVDPLDIYGSRAGAFGAPQFLPTSYLAYGVDADGDGRVRLDHAEDAAASCARYFAEHGWHAGLSNRQQRAAVWEYNHSSAYVDTVLALAARIGTTPVAHQARGTARKHPRQNQAHPRAQHVRAG
jgi:peptidoglycan lytic transglycosylase B